MKTRRWVRRESWVKVLVTLCLFTAGSTCSTRNRSDTQNQAGSPAAAVPEFQEATPAPSPPLSTEQRNAFRTAKTVRVVVKDSYWLMRVPSAPDQGIVGVETPLKGVSLPFEELARKVFAYPGVEVVGADAEGLGYTL